MHLTSLSVRKKNGQHTPGRIVVHDRSKVESDILPRYFNHASFASLRRQLNYFAFTRVGKGKQKGATYCNDQVIELFDILRLKRRVVGSTVSLSSSSVIPESKINEPTKKGGKSDAAGSTNSGKKRSPRSMSPLSHAISVESKSRSNQKNGKSSTKQQPGKRKKTSRNSKQIIDSIVPVIHLPKKAKVEDAGSYWNTLEKREEKDETKACSVSVSPPPADNPLNCSSEPQIILDLTKPLTSSNIYPATFHTFTTLTQGAADAKTHNTKEEDVLAGCSALLALGCQSSS